MICFCYSLLKYIKTISYAYIHRYTHARAHTHARIYIYIDIWNALFFFGNHLAWRIYAVTRSFTFRDINFNQVPFVFSYISQILRQSGISAVFKEYLYCSTASSPNMAHCETKKLWSDYIPSMWIVQFACKWFKNTLENNFDLWILPSWYIKFCTKIRATHKKRHKNKKFQSARYRHTSLIRFRVFLHKHQKKVNIYS